MMTSDKWQSAEWNGGSNREQAHWITNFWQ